MTHTKSTGDFGERVAKKYLTGKGLFVLSEKYHTRHGEIDLIAWDRDHSEVVFVEVKTRSGTNFGWPEESVDSRKKQRLQKSAYVFLQEKYEQLAPKHRFDIVSILIDAVSRKAQVYHFKNIEI